MNAHPPRVAAFFDLDRTLVRENTAALFARYLYRNGEASALELAGGLAWVFLNKFNVVNIENLMQKMFGRMRGKPESETIALCERWFHDSVLAHVSDTAVERVNHHLGQKHLVAILSASTPYVCRPLARHLGIDHYICTIPEVGTDGLFTGDVRKPVCYGDGKLHWAKAFADQHRVDLTQSYFYTDSFSDLPVMLAVGHPIAVNPDPQLKSYARRKKWQTARF